MASDHASFPSFQRDLNDRVREHARVRGTSPESEMQQWVLQRLMVRMFASQPDDWMIKGGQSLLTRWPDARSTSDVDVMRIEAVPIAEVITDYRRALEHDDYGDHLTFVPVDSEIMVATTARVQHAVHLGGEELMTIASDVVLPDSIPLWKAPETVGFQPHIHPSGDERENPDLRIISAFDTLAHKVAGMFTKHWQGGPPNRVQDLVDALFLAERLPWDGPETHAVVNGELDLRRAEGKNLAVPDRFEVPNPEWREGFAAHAAATPGLPYRTLEQAVPAARRFLDPLLAPEPPQADWDPRRSQWVERSAQDTRSGAARLERTDMTRLDSPTGFPSLGPSSGPEKGSGRPSPSPRPRQGSGPGPDNGQDRSSRNGM